MTDAGAIYGIVHRVDGVLLADEREHLVQRVAEQWLRVTNDPDYAVRALSEDEKRTLTPNPDYREK